MTNKFNPKSATVALGMMAMLAGVGVVTPMSASAQPHDYDGYCYVKKDDLAGHDAALGAIGGALAGGLLGKKGHKGQDALVGAAAGGTAGFVIGKGSKQKVRCSKGRYYVYEHGYYDPAPADRGFNVVFFDERPDNVDLYVVSKSGRVKPYHGH
jgi:hypothetical protein